MATSSRPSDLDVSKSPVEERLRNEPYLFEFFQAVRLLERFLPDKVEVGKFAPPSAEVARFQANSTLAFPASEIQTLSWPEKGPVKMKVNFMGLTGPEGVLPLNYTLLLAERARAGDSSAVDLFDTFNHRIISLFFQAWEKYRFWIAYERGDRDQFSHHLLDLTEPLSPVITVRQLRGISTSMFLRLCWRAPCTEIRSSITGSTRGGNLLLWRGLCSSANCAITISDAHVHPMRRTPPPHPPEFCRALFLPGDL